MTCCNYSLITSHLSAFIYNALLCTLYILRSCVIIHLQITTHVYAIVNLSLYIETDIILQQCNCANYSCVHVAAHFYALHRENIYELYSRSVTITKDHCQCNELCASDGWCRYVSLGFLNIRRKYVIDMLLSWKIVCESNNMFNGILDACF